MKRACREWEWGHGAGAGLRVWRWIAWVAMGGLWLVAACTNEAEAFCKETTAALCEACYGCGGDDKENSNRCGLSVQTNEEGCKIILRRVCISEGVTNYTGESAERCRRRVRELTCKDAKTMQSVKHHCGIFF